MARSFRHAPFPRQNVDRDIGHYGKAYFLMEMEMEKASQNWMSKEITIQHEQLPKNYIYSLLFRNI
jgi:hypothetical protein